MNNSATPIGENGKMQKKKSKELKVSHVGAGKINQLMEYWENYKNEFYEDGKYVSLEVISCDFPINSKQNKKDEVNHINTEIIPNVNEVTVFKLGNIKENPSKVEAFKKGLERAKNQGKERIKKANKTERESSER